MLSRHIKQEVCPFNQRFAEEADEPGYAARGPGELPTGVEPVPGVEALPGERAVETGESVSAETGGVGNPTHPGTEVPSLVELMRMTRAEWDTLSRGSAIRRAGYSGFKRNVAVAMGNRLASVDTPPEEAVAVLRQAMENGSRWCGSMRRGRLQRSDGPPSGNAASGDQRPNRSTCAAGPPFYIARPSIDSEIERHRRYDQEKPDE